MTQNDEKKIFGFPAYPPFQLGQPRFSQDSFLGRWLHFNDVIDPRTLFATEKQLNDCLLLLEEYRAGKLQTSVSDEVLWRAQKLKMATFHPDTGEKIFMPFRMAGFVPFGSPIVTGLLIPNPTLVQTVFWQWLNQSHNACVNYANRNASKPTPVSKFIQGYAGAVTAAVSVAVGLSILIKKADHFTPTTKALVQKFVPFPAVSFASTCNVLLMRWHETKQGIEVFDSYDTKVGTSRIAAQKALRDTAITRAFLPAPIFILPPIIMSLLERTKFLKRNPKFHLPFNAIACTLSFGFALPIAIALFPQVSKVNVTDLEDEIQKATTHTVLHYNKGL